MRYRALSSGSRRDAGFDGLVLSAAAAAVAVSVLGPPPLREFHYGALAVAGEVAFVLALLYRRRAPQTLAWIMVAGSGVAAAVQLAAPETLVRAAAAPETSLWIPAAAPFVTYAALAFGRTRTGWVPVALLVVTAARPWEPHAGRTATAVLLIAGPAALGSWAATRRRVMEGLVRQALADERARLAAEMHDVVAHRVGLMVMKAGVLGLTGRDEDVRAAAEELRVNGCRALDELRELVAFLRTPADDVPRREPPAIEQPTVPPIAELIAESRAVGTPVDLTEEGDPALAAPPVARTAFRVVQESLTNVRKHAPGARVRARIRYEPDVVRVTVENTAPGRPGDTVLAATGSGAGLLALRERVELMDGTLAAGRVGDGGFKVDVTLPSRLPAATRGGPKRGP
ncbi:histidine kinase [Spirillospora sp. NBC_00431]